MEIEEKIASGSITSQDLQMKRTRKLVLGRRAMNDMHIDISVGMFYSELIMFFIIVSTASTIYKAGANDVGQPSTWPGLPRFCVLSQAMRHTSCSLSAS